MAQDTQFLGMHRQPMPDGSPDQPAGFFSFEVFGVHNDNNPDWEPGYYWWSCQPGCLPDGEPSGPFPTAEGAYLDAIGD